jgi:hypothetical protein
VNCGYPGSRSQIKIRLHTAHSESCARFLPTRGTHTDVSLIQVRSCVCLASGSSTSAMMLRASRCNCLQLSTWRRRRDRGTHHGRGWSISRSTMAFYITFQNDSAPRSLSVILNLAMPMSSVINFTGPFLGTILQPLAKQGSWYIDLDLEAIIAKPSAHPKRHLVVTWHGNSHLFARHRRVLLSTSSRTCTLGHRILQRPLYSNLPFHATAPQTIPWRCGDRKALPALALKEFWPGAPRLNPSRRSPTGRVLITEVAGRRRRTCTIGSETSCCGSFALLGCAAGMHPR